MTIAAIYLRVSTDRQTVQVQQADLLRLAQALAHQADGIACRG